MNGANQDLELPIIRPPVLADAPAVTGLMNLCAMMQTGTLQMSVDQLLAIWTAPDFDLAADAWLAVTVDDHLTGYAELWQHPEGETLPYVWLHVAPGPDAEQVAACLLCEAEARVRALHGNDPHIVLRTATASSSQVTRRLLARAGYRLAERQWRGTEILPHRERHARPHVTRCIVCRAFVPGDDWQMWRCDIFEKELQAEAA